MTSAAVSSALDEPERTPALSSAGKAQRGSASKAQRSNARKAKRSERPRRLQREAEPVAVDVVAERDAVVDVVAEGDVAVDTSAPELRYSDTAEPEVELAPSVRPRSAAARGRKSVRRALAEPTLTEASDEIAPVTRGRARRDLDEGPAVMTAASLFHHANSARREGLSSEALHSYERLRAEFPGSAEARLSLVLAARMHLDSGRLGDAVAGFDAYIATRDRSLREQALAGRAIALGRLGRTREELAAWQSLLLDYPDSSYAPVASQRLRQGQR